MSSVSGKPGYRRDFLKLAATAAAVGPFFLFPARARAQKKTLKTLKIAKWAHFVPEHDAWFENVLAKEWGRQHDTEVTVDHIPVEEIGARASAEAAARRGHDLFMFPWPPAEYQRQVIDHAEIYQSVSFRHGNVDRLGHKSTFDPKTKKYFAFADSWMPAPLLYFEDYWSAVNMPLGRKLGPDGLRRPLATEVGRAGLQRAAAIELAGPDGPPGNCRGGRSGFKL